MFEVEHAVSELLGIDLSSAEKIVTKAMAGGEIGNSCSPERWFNERLQPNIVFIDETGYAEMCVDALKILGTTAATDYGSSRQRDLGQLWADMTRGYLGELALTLFLKKKWQIDSRLGHQIGVLEDYLPTDLHEIKIGSGEYRVPKISVSIKTTKWNGIWLDIPGDQFEHSDIHVLVKVGTGRDHLFAFFKSISVFRDKILRRGQDVGSLTSQEADSLYEQLPSFKPIPAYIAGFVCKNNAFTHLPYQGHKGKKHYNISSWNGPILPGDLNEIKKNEGIVGNIKFEGIGNFAHDKGYLFNTGILAWTDTEWNQVLERM